ncbi:hypothetical protein Godav_016533 [Gossypium davidsonii]|uniref:RNase H type-1 domain-containing protein n=1 Tax=Gossypium davidsonii TaxID=34287 RepID=A0A7J8RSD6_GOSDV|nr:hypothetical protein [Gossypium davidsonii]
MCQKWLPRDTMGNSVYFGKERIWLFSGIVVTWWEALPTRWYRVDMRSGSAIAAIVDGLETVWEKGVRQLIIESDSRTAVDLILGSKMVGLPRLASEVHNWISRDWQVDRRFDMYHEQQIWLLMLYTRQ